MKYLLFVSAMAIGLSTQAARAAEGATYGGPVGGTDIRNAYIPSQPGLYFSFVDNLPGSDKSYDQFGRVDKSIDVRTAVNTDALGVAYVYPFKVLGANATSGIQGNYQAGYIRINGKGNGLGSLGDPFVNLLALSWDLGQLFGEAPPPPDTKLPYGLVVQASYSMILPLGHYRKEYILTPGKNDFYYIPNFAATYLFGPNALGDGLEISVRLFNDIAGTNRATKYANGLVLDTDFAISERTGRWQWGLAGTYAQQVQDDKQYGIKAQPNGKILEILTLGPVIAYDFPDIEATIKLKIQLPVITQNTLALTRAVLTYAMKF